MIKMFKYFVFVFLIFETLIADVFKVRINDKVEVIPAFYEARTLYISLPDFLRLLEVDYTSDTLNGSFLFQISGYTFKFISENPFVVVSSGG